MFDWAALTVGPTVKIFGQPVDYFPQPTSPIYGAGLPIRINAVFDEAALAAGTVSDSRMSIVRPVLGIEMAQLPPGYVPKNAQDDEFVIVATGVRYVVKDGRTDSHGWAFIEASRAPYANVDSLPKP